MMKISNDSNGTVPATPIFIILLTLFFCSGLCALAYEVIWARMLSLVFGSTIHAIATVLGVFMFGLGLGSFFAGRSIGKISNPTKIYGYLEIALGSYTLLFPLIMTGVQAIHSMVFQSLYESPLLLLMGRFVLAAGTLIIPTALMGATLPLLCHYLSGHENSSGQSFGRLYGLNTLGAALGAFLCAFVLIPAIGLNATMYASAGLNIVIGCAALWLPPFAVRSTAEAGSPLKESVLDVPRKRPTGILPALAVIGCTGMMLENAWSHSLILVFGTSVYAFATMLVTYLLGLGIGSLAASKVADKVRNPWLFFVSCIGLQGLAIFISTPFIGRLPHWFMEVFADMDVAWTRVVSLEFAVSFAVMFIPTFLSGACFPLAICSIQSDRGAGRSASNAYVFNTSGCIVGSLATGFIIIPGLGSEKTLLLAGSLSLILFSVFLIRGDGSLKPRWHNALALASLVVAAAAPWGLRTWDSKVMNAGVYAYARQINAGGKGNIGDTMAKYSLLYSREGSANVAVLESRSGHRFLRINGKTDGSDLGDNYTQMFLSLIPSLYSRRLDDLLVIGLGTGITSGSALDLPFRSVESIEISPEVRDAAQGFFSKLNAAVFTDPRSKVHILDGRTWLMALPKSYDIITSEPSNPWQTGNANLFTVDFFKLAAARLKPGGVFCQWLPHYHMDKSHFKLILKSVSSVFPHVNVWMVNTDTLILSSFEPLMISEERIGQLLSIPAVREKLVNLKINSAEELLGFFYLDHDGVKGMASGIDGFNTDTRPIVEFDSPKYTMGPNRPDVFLEILENSYTARLPYGEGVTNQSANIGRIRSREKFYEEWRVPQELTQTMLQRSLSR